MNHCNDDGFPDPGTRDVIYDIIILLYLICHGVFDLEFLACVSLYYLFQSATTAFHVNDTNECRRHQKNLS